MNTWLAVSIASAMGTVLADVAIILVLTRAVRTRSRGSATVAVKFLAAMLMASGLSCVAALLCLCYAAPWMDAVAATVSLLLTICAGYGLVRVILRLLAFRNYDYANVAFNELRQSRERFERALVGSGNGLWEWNIGDDAVWYADRFREMIGYQSVEEFPDRFASWENSLHPDDKQNTLNAIQAHLQQDDAYDIDYRLRTKQGEYRWFRARGVAIRRIDGSPYIMSGSIQDIHERKVAEQELRQLQEYSSQKHKLESLGEFASGIAHEFNNMMQAIGGQLEFIHRAIPAGSRASRDLKIAMRLLKQTKSVCARLLAFGRFGGSQVEAIRPNDVLIRLRTLLRPMIGKSIELNVEKGKNLGRVMADTIGLQQALVNLCINARDAMPNGGTLTLATSQVEVAESECERYDGAAPGNYVVFSVTDTGRGIDSALLSKIFQPFVTTKSVGHGTGLGLSITASIAKEHGGFIDVESRVGEGSTFRIGIPARARRNRQDTPAAPLVYPAKRQHRILYAEDEAIVRRNTKRILQECGYCVVVARDGARAVEIFDQKPEAFDLALLDISMPNMDGIEVFGRLRSLRPRLPVVFCTAFAAKLHQQQILQNDNTSVLDKPYSSHLLRRVVAEALAEADSCNPVSC